MTAFQKQCKHKIIVAKDGEPVRCATCNVLLVLRKGKWTPKRSVEKQHG